MKQFINIALAVLIGMSIGGSGLPIGIGGDDIATAYVRDYCIGLSQLSDFADTIENSEKTSAALAKEWEEMTRDVRLKASKTLDQHVVEKLNAGASREDFADLVRKSCKRWGQIGEAL